MEDGAIFSHHVQVSPVGLKTCDVNIDRGLYRKVCCQIVQCLLHSLGQQ